jgi:hypothetical protein
MTQYDYGDPVNASTEATLQTLPMGRVYTPTAAIPDSELGSGWGTSASVASYIPGDTEIDMQYLYADCRTSQTFTLVGTYRLTSIAVSLNPFLGDAIVSIGLHRADVNGYPTGAAITSTTVTTSEIAGNTVFPVPMATLAPGAYCIVCRNLGPSPVGYSTGATGYAGTHMTKAPGEAWQVESDDMWFRVYAQAQLGFVATTNVEAKNSGSSKTGSLDVLARVPCDHGYLHCWHAFGASSGFLIDLYDTEGVYYTIPTAGTAGVTLLSECDIRGNLRPRPGANTYVLVCGFGNVTPANATWEVSLFNVWSDPTWA